MGYCNGYCVSYLSVCFGQNLRIVSIFSLFPVHQFEIKVKELITTALKLSEPLDQNSEIIKQIW